MQGLLEEGWKTIDNLEGRSTAFEIPYAVVLTHPPFPKYC